MRCVLKPKTHDTDLKANIKNHGASYGNSFKIKLIA